MTPEKRKVQKILLTKGNFFCFFRKISHYLFQLRSLRPSPTCPFLHSSHCNYAGEKRKDPKASFLVLWAV